MRTGDRHPPDVRIARPRGHRPACARGFTLVELLVAVTIVAILAATAMPSFQSAMVRSTIRSLSSSLGTDLAFARSEAVRLGAAVTLCPRSGTVCGTDWSNGWLVFREDPSSSPDGLRAVTETLLREQAAVPSSGYTITRAAGSGGITFLGSGSTRNATAVTLSIRYPGTAGRDIAVSVIGRLSTTTVN